MAAMGARKVTAAKLSRPQGTAPQSLTGAALPHGLNLVIRTTEFAPVMQRSVDLPVVGLPIMREGFVTETGFLTHPAG
jgi:hypothetical protein